MGKALYRKYRSRSFAEVVGQEPITGTLSKAIKSGRISHAYLFSGPRGVGKTSVARILAHEVNQLKYVDEAVHLDIIEIDAASNRRIDEIRDIREKVHIAPSSAKYKVYIIDEVHMLTKEAFNALLKTLEEPPPHCIFIMATTEPHKLPQTIISRAQRFSFKPIAKDKAVNHLKSIAKAEKIDIEPAALELLADHGDGSFRDSISLLDQLSSSGRQVSARDVGELLGLPPSEALSQLLRCLVDGNINDALDILSQLRAEGASPALLAAQLAKRLRGEMLAGHYYRWAISLLKDLLDVSSAKQPFEQLEIAVLDAAQKSASEQSPLSTTDTTNNPSPQITTKKRSVVGFNIAKWPDVVTEVKKRAPSLYTAIRLAHPHLSGDILSLDFQFSLHRNKVNEARHKELISNVIEDLCGTKIAVRCGLFEKKVNTKKKSSKSSSPNEESSQLTAINNIFGSAEMLES